MSYFVGAEAMGNDKFKGEDAGFAINGGKGWSKAVLNNHQIDLNGPTAQAMGSYDFTCATTGGVVTVQYTFGYKRNDDGKVRIYLHHSSAPYSPAPVVASDVAAAAEASAAATSCGVDTSSFLLVPRDWLTLTPTDLADALRRKAATPGGYVEIEALAAPVAPPAAAAEVSARKAEAVEEKAEAVDSEAVAVKAVKMEEKNEEVVAEAAAPPLCSPRGASEAFGAPLSAEAAAEAVAADAANVPDEQLSPGPLLRKAKGKKGKSKEEKRAEVEAKSAEAERVEEEAAEVAEVAEAALAAEVTSPSLTVTEATAPSLTHDEMPSVISVMAEALAEAQRAAENARRAAQVAAAQATAAEASVELAKRAAARSEGRSPLSPLRSLKRAGGGPAARDHGDEVHDDISPHDSVSQVSVSQVSLLDRVARGWMSLLMGRPVDSERAKIQSSPMQTVGMKMVREGQGGLWESDHKPGDDEVRGVLLYDERDPVAPNASAMQRVEASMHV